tara:strand:- start:268 stop:867 length:600 start_codon:yes stop_codon:yes gene_type:complete
LKKKTKQPLKIGLTGGIGSGKTTISSIFESLNIPVFNSDQISKYILQDNKCVIETIVQKFGKTIIKNNQINTAKLAKIVFSDKIKLITLNNIIHPHVLNKFNDWIRNKDSKYIIKESAILFESKTYQQLDKIILVQSPLHIRIERTCKRDNRTKEDVKNIIKNQIKDAEAIKYADYIIKNNNKLLLPKIIQLHEVLSNL